MEPFGSSVAYWSEYCSPPPPPWVRLFLASTVLWKLLKMIRDGKRNVNKDVQFSISKGVLSIIHSNKILKYLKLRPERWLRVQRTRCSSRKSQFESWHPHGSSQPCNSSPGDLVPSYIHAGRTPMQIK